MSLLDPQEQLNVFTEVHEARANTWTYFIYLFIYFHFSESLQPVKHARTQLPLLLRPVHS